MSFSPCSFTLQGFTVWFRASHLSCYVRIIKFLENNILDVLRNILFIVLTVYIAEDLNEYFALNHKMFTRHQYFDSSGLFISFFMSTPLLLASAFIVVSCPVIEKVNRVSSLGMFVKIQNVQKCRGSHNFFLFSCLKIGKNWNLSILESRIFRKIGPTPHCGTSKMDTLKCIWLHLVSGQLVSPINSTDDSSQTNAS